MIRTEIWLYDTFERQVFFQAADIIENHRRELQEAQKGNAAPGRRAVDVLPAGDLVEPPLASGEVDPLDVHVGPQESEAPVATIVAPGKAITLADMEKAAQAAIQIGGLAQVRAIVNEYGKSRIREIDSNLWPEVIEKLANVKPLEAAE